MSYTKRKPVSQQESMKEYFLRLRNESIELSKLHKDLKPIRYLLK